jgi:hypothetical protein
VAKRRVVKPRDAVTGRTTKASATDRREITARLRVRMHNIGAVELVQSSDAKLSVETAHPDARHRRSRASATKRRVLTTHGVAGVELVRPRDV